jgi:hypothetical protein
MKEATKRPIFRWIHLIFAIPIIGYVYSPFKELPNYAPVVRYVAVPVIALRDFGCGKAIFFDDLFRKLVRCIQ